MKKSKYPIGVDIGSHTVKVCQLRRVGGLYELEKFGSAQIYPDGEPPSDADKQYRAKVDALKRALDDGQIRARHSVSAVFGESIIVRYLQLPQMPEDELKKALQWEAEEYIPFRLSEVNLDSMVLGNVEDADHAKMEVLLVSAKKDLVNNHVAMLREAGLEPRIIDVDSFAFLNCFEINHEPGRDDCVALVNIGGEFTSINIYNNGVSRFSRDIPVGGDTMTTAIRAHMKCAFPEAERYKIDFGVAPVAENGESENDETQIGSLLDTIRGTVEQLSGEEEKKTPEAIVQGAINNVTHNLFSEVRRSIEFFENQYRGTNVSRLVLGGGTAMLKNLVENFEREFQLPVEVIDPLRQIRVSSRNNQGDRLNAQRHQLAVGIGLGIRAMAA